MKQCSILTAKESFSFRTGGKGRVINIAKGEKLEVMTSETSNLASRTVKIARLGKGVLSQGWLFSFEQIGELFTVDA